MRTVEVAGSPEVAFAHVDDLDRYPAWMALVHDVTAVADTADQTPVWDVELRAQVGPFARSKQLRMARTTHEPPHRAVFERRESDGRVHAPWVLAVDVDEAGAMAVVTMHLTYGGALWTGAVLQRVLDDHVERGAQALQDLIAHGA